jgi:hypothetical protein
MRLAGGHILSGEQPDGQTRDVRFIAFRLGAAPSMTSGERLDNEPMLQTPLDFIRQCVAKSGQRLSGIVLKWMRIEISASS